MPRKLIIREDRRPEPDPARLAHALLLLIQERLAAPPATDQAKEPRRER